MASNVADLGAEKTADNRLDDPIAAEKGSISGVGATGVVCTSEDVGCFLLARVFLSILRPDAL